MVDKNSFEYVSSKLGAVKPETRLIAKELFDAAKKSGHQIWFMWGMGGGKEHGSGLALDLMVRNEAAGDFLRDYIWANRSRLRLHHVIWEQHITSTVVQPGVRRKMADRGSTTENHYDHNHVWFFPGTYVAPVQLGGGTHAPTPGGGGSSKPPSKPPVVIVKTMKRGSEGPDVKRLQSELRRVFPAYAGELARDGSFGPKTEAAVKEFQRRAGLAVDGKVGPKTRAALKTYGVRL